jgi:AbrB family looped-hinge helix DNA binding protein
METVTLSPKGQLVIPKAVRDHAGVLPGSQFTVRYVDGEIRLRPLPAPRVSSLEEVSGCLARPGRKHMSDAQTQAATKVRLTARNAP